jgi:hypothetical protein
MKYSFGWEYEKHKNIKQKIRKNKYAVICKKHMTAFDFYNYTLCEIVAKLKHDNIIYNYILKNDSFTYESVSYHSTLKSIIKIIDNMLKENGYIDKPNLKTLL